MEIVVVTHPTLDEYYARVTAMAQKYGRENWLSLSADEMSREDRFEYSFIISAVGAQLVHREWLCMSETPGHSDFADGTSTEPGLVPGSVFLAGVQGERVSVCGPN